MTTPDKHGSFEAYVEGMSTPKTFAANIVDDYDYKWSLNAPDDPDYNKLQQVIEAEVTARDQQWRDLYLKRLDAQAAIWKRLNDEARKSGFAEGQAEMLLRVPTEKESWARLKECFNYDDSGEWQLCDKFWRDRLIGMDAE